jgi:hypothetical protein
MAQHARLLGQFPPSITGRPTSVIIKSMCWSSSLRKSSAHCHRLQEL